MEKTTIRVDEASAEPTDGNGQYSRGAVASAQSHRSDDLISPDNLPLAKRFVSALKHGGESFFLTDQIEKHLAEFLESESDHDPKVVRAIRRAFRGCGEILFDAEAAYAVLRPDVGLKRIVRLHPASEYLEEVDRDNYLEIKDAYIQGHEEAAKKGLELDFAPFFRAFPKVNEPSEMGSGVSLLNRHLSGLMYRNPDVFRRALLDFLRNHQLDGHSLLINEHITSPEQLRKGLSVARSILSDQSPDQPYGDVEHDLWTLGFERGWGRTVGEVGENLALLNQVMESSDPARFERLLGRLPLIRTVLMVSPHGWFAQDDVLGKPDTGGQVTYVLDQARAIEHEMRRQFFDCGIEATPRVIILTRLIPNAEGTTCDSAREQIFGTEDSWIVRAPFRDQHGEIIPDWISRFQIWPYLEDFATESKQLVAGELLGRPDLIIGHYSDGNLVAHRLADEFGVTHCACVHALEKTKYLLSDMYWADMEHDYRFSMQFTADLIAYNSADTIISSSFREVGGTPSEMGMAESYELFSMPGLYRVKSGFDPRLARHNIVPPGANEEYFFPNTDRARRVEAVTRDMEQRLLSKEPGENCFGLLKDTGLPFIFAMARMDKIKNLSGLVEIFGKSGSLRGKANLLLISSLIDAAESNDQEEIAEVTRTYELIDEYDLKGHIRWCAARLDKVETGEIYRIVADGRGVFAQPAFMETFGLTVVEAMACGLPVVATCYGGPAEIVEDEKSGRIVDPNDHQAFAEALRGVVSDAQVWERFHENGMHRVEESFTWSRHAAKLLQLANVYTYWNYIDVMNRQALDQYIHTLYHTVYRPRTRAMLEESG